jgi:ATP-dependent DNA ligase
VLPFDLVTMPLGRLAQPFDHAEWVFELKYDGFRSLASVEYGRCTLTSRNGNTFASFADLAQQIGSMLLAHEAVLDGEIVCLEAIVAKRATAPYVSTVEQTTWFKICNRQYSQMVGREELFERDRHREPVAVWH